MTYFAEQGFCQVLHMRKKYRDRLDMSKTGGKAIRLKLTNFQTALKTLADKHHRKVRISWNELFLEIKEINNIYSTNAFAFVLFCATRLPVYISLAMNYFQNKILFSEKL